MRRRVEIHIDELVVTGLPVAHPERLSAAVADAIRARLRAEPVPDAGPAVLADAVAATVTAAV